MGNITDNKTLTQKIARVMIGPSLLFLVGLGSYLSLTSALHLIKKSDNPLRDKVGFETSGRLNDGRGVTYKIEEYYPEGIAEIVYLFKPDTHEIGDGLDVIIEYNRDLFGIDEVVLNHPGFGKGVKISQGEYGVISYDEYYLNFKQSREIMGTANYIFIETKGVLGIEEKLKNYPPKIIGNPLKFEYSKAELEK